jgi:hypothetical protein
MKKWIVLICTCFLAMFLSGCGSTRTTYSTDKMGAPMQTTEERSFFSSENLGDYYTFEAKRVDNHNAAVNNKLTAIKENIAARMTTVKMTATEALLMSVIDSQTIASIPVDPPTPGKAPKTIVDVADGNLTNWLNLGLNAYNTNRANNTRSKNDGDDGVTINNTGSGDFFWKSNGNKTNAFTLDNGSSGTLDTSNKKSDTTDSHDDNSTKTGD